MDTNESLEPVAQPVAPKLSASIEINDQQKENFFKAFLADAPYTEEFSVFDGKFKMVFKTLTVEENNDVLAQVAKDQASGTAQNTDLYFVQVVLYRLGLSLTHINDLPFAPDTAKDKDSSYVVVRAEMFKKYQVTKQILIQSKFSEFERRVNKLTEEIANQDFWKAAV